MPSTMPADSALDRPISRWTMSARSARVKVPTDGFLIAPKSAIETIPLGLQTATLEQLAPYSNVTLRAEAGARYGLVTNCRGTPGEAAAHRLEHEQVTLPDPPVADRGVEGQRDRRRGGIGMPVDGDDHLLRRQAELPGGGVEDALVCLVRDHPVHVLRDMPGGVQHLVHHLGEI